MRADDCKCGHPLAPQHSWVDPGYCQISCPCSGYETAPPAESDTPIDTTAPVAPYHSERAFHSTACLDANFVPCFCGKEAADKQQIADEQAIAARIPPADLARYLAERAEPPRPLTREMLIEAAARAIYAANTAENWRGQQTTMPVGAFASAVTPAVLSLIAGDAEAVGATYERTLPPDRLVMFPYTEIASYADRIRALMGDK